jgi:rhomboid protease GluP
MNIDNWGHLGGLLGGLIFAWFGGPLLEITGYPQRVLVDRRTPSQVRRAALLVFAIFGFLALVEIFF